MKSYMENAGTVKRSWYIIDATGKSLGRVAAEAASILRGKNKPTFTPHADCGDHVIIVNCDAAVLTGNKLNQKMYRHHTGYAGGLKETSYRRLMATKPEFALKEAVRGMLPKGPLGYAMLKKLHVYAGPNHEHQAQKPVVFEVK